jgi:hypothetical protein
MSKKNIWNNIFSMVSGVFGADTSSRGRIKAVSNKITKHTKQSLDSVWDQALEFMDVEHVLPIILIVRVLKMRM